MPIRDDMTVFFFLPPSPWWWWLQCQRLEYLVVELTHLSSVCPRQYLVWCQGSQPWQWSGLSSGVVPRIENIQLTQAFFHCHKSPKFVVLYWQWHISLKYVVWRAILVWKPQRFTFFQKMPASSRLFWLSHFLNLYPLPLYGSLVPANRRFQAVT